MAEGRLQREGELIHVILSCCYNFSKLLRHLTASRDEQLPLLTFSHADEKSLPPGQDKKAHVRETGQEKLFSGARNFK
jgi:error-prone DNA polymerase